MNNKNGFTLIELLAVILILGVIALIAIPTVNNIVVEAKKGAATTSAANYINSVENAVAKSMLTLEEVLTSSTYDVSELNSKINLSGTTPTKGSLSVDSNGLVTFASLCVNNFKITYNNSVTTVVANNCDDMTYLEANLNGTNPVLGTNMIPVNIANDGTVTYANTNAAWYNYEDKKWANAVMLSSGSFNVGDIIPDSSIRSYFVWIPRYKYKIFDEGNYNSTPTQTPGVSDATTIEVVFENKNQTVSNGTSVGSWLTHPAFTTMNVDGFWAAKYETGYLGATSTLTAEVASSDSSKIIIKPNVYSWRNNNVYNIFLSSYNYDRVNDSHMMKNTEWGAILYLAHSVYGSKAKINNNNNSSYKTGYSSLPTANQTVIPGVTGDGSIYNSLYNTDNGYLASTTGNITGVYDMSGGAHEYMASYVTGFPGTSGFTTTTLADYNPKYFDVYSSSSTSVSYNLRILGDATGELGPFLSYADPDGSSRKHNNWYRENSYFLDTAMPWFCRGGYYDRGSLSGQFYFSKNTGAAVVYLGSRVVLTP